MFAQFTSLTNTLNVLKKLRSDRVGDFLMALKDFTEADSMQDKVKSTLKLLAVFAEGSNTQLDDLTISILHNVAETQMFGYFTELVSKGIDKSSDTFSTQSFGEDPSLAETKEAFELQAIPWTAVLMIAELVVSLILQSSSTTDA